MKKGSINPAKAVICFLSIALLVLPAFCFASGFVPTPTGGACTGEPSGTTDCGNYQLSDFVQIGILIAAYIIKISGSLALLFFIYGGFMFLLSAGNPQRVQSGKTILTNAIIGLIIIFFSYAIIDFVIVKVLKVKNSSGWSTSGWYK